MRDKFLLRPDVTYLNFGSYGACPRQVFEKYQQFQLMLEEEPVHFIHVDGQELLQQSRISLAEYINAPEQDIVFVTNPSYAVNIVAKSFPLQPGDEVLATDIEYGACDRTWNYYCKKRGAIYKRQPIRFPLESKQDFIDQFFGGVSNKTKLIFISHITSSTALLLPVEEICIRAKEFGIPVFIDGAHAPGQIPVDIKKLDPDMYTGACHKWMMTPKGCSFLYTKKSMQHLLDPLVISWGYEALFPSHSQFQDYHQMQGTRDFSAFLTVPQSIKFMQENNWVQVAKDCRTMVKENARRFCNLVNAHPIAPLTDDFYVQMFSAEIKTPDPEKLHDHFYNEYKIQIPVMRQDDKVYLRYSINGFNTQKDLDILFSAIEKIKSTSKLIQ